MSKKSFFSSRTIVVSVLVVAILLIAGTAVYAALADIDVEDGSISDWAGVPIFQTDPAGDNSPEPADEDIISARVATGYDDNLYFLVQMNGSSAISAGGNRGVAASIDCQPNDVDQEQDDRVVTYFPGPDERYACEGDGNRCYFGDAEGQRVGAYLEWMVDESELPPDTFSTGDCQTHIKIRFAVIEKGESSSDPVLTFDTTGSLKGYNVPTATGLLTLDARADSSGLLVLVVTAAMLLLSVTLIVFRIRRTA